MPSKMRTFANHETQMWLAHVERGKVRAKMHKIDRKLVQSETLSHSFICSTASIWNYIWKILALLIQQTKCGYASQAHWHQILWKQLSSAGIWHDISSESYQRESLTEKCLSSLALLSKESVIMGRVQTLPTAQHELHRVAPSLCRVDGRCSGGPRLIVFRDPGTLSRSDISCLHLE